MPKHQIKRFIQEPNCQICGRPVRGWARSQCDNCGSNVCRRHRPLFVEYWQCPDCDKRQSSFNNTTPLPQQAPIPAPNPAPSNNLFSQLDRAEHLYKESQEAEANTVTASLFVSLMNDE